MDGMYYSHSVWSTYNSAGYLNAFIRLGHESAVTGFIGLKECHKPTVANAPTFIIQSTRHFNIHVRVRLKYLVAGIVNNSQEAADKNKLDSNSQKTHT